MKQLLPHEAATFLMLSRTRWLSVVILLIFMLSQTAIYAQGNIRITGKLTASGTSEALPGVNVVVKGTNLGTATNKDGTYQINVPAENSTLVFSSVGYLPQEVVVGKQSTINVTLEADSKTLQDVVVVGYGTQRKSQLTGAISSVSAKDIQTIPVTSADQALQGRAAGVDVIASSHAPGATATIRVRGVSSIRANNDPLFVVDGIPISGGLSDINPNIIESMEVLKDASATAIYGARGSSGVILITTKRGKDGRTQVTYDGYMGVSQIANKVEVLDAEGWVNYKATAFKTRQLDKLLDNIELKNYQAGKQVDWQNLNLRNGIQQSHNIGVLGGNQKTRFSVNANFLKQNGIVYNSDFTRGSLQINIDHQISNRFRIGTSTLLSYSSENLINQGQVLGQAMRIGPLGDVYNEDGTYRLFPTSEALLGNPRTDAENEKNQRFRTRLFSSLYAEAELWRGLKYRLNFGPDFSFENVGRFIGSYTNTLQGAPNRATNSKSDTKAYTLENLLTFSRTIKDIHAFDVTLLQSVQQQTLENNTLEATGIPSEKMLWHDLSSGQIRSFDTDQQQWSILSYMARVNYSLMGKYLITLTARRDGSSRFGQDRKFGFFPSAAVAWRIADEKFITDIRAISDLKLRASYGAVGNTALNPYQSMGSLTRRSYLFGSEAALGFEPNTLPNFDLGWETSHQANIGLDFGLFNNRIAGTLEYYQIKTTDLLLNRALPQNTGFGSILANIGSTKNTGFEFTLNTMNVQTQDGFKWTTSLNGAINKNQITDLYGNGKDDVGNSWFIGQPINVFYNLQFDGIWQANEVEQAKVYSRTPGQIKVKDLNNDGKITGDDRVIIGSAIPKWTGGITNTFNYKGFDLSIFVNTRQKFMVNSDVYALDNLEARYNIPRFVNYYTPENPSNDYPAPVTPGMNNPNIDLMRYRDASYVRVRNINLGYTFGTQLVKRIGLQSLRLYVSGQNLFTFTKFQGWDPESGGNLGSYPSTRLILFGLNASL
ncbi:TonB-dependent receptor [Spirosoma sp. BT702]|uniref:TonB-dependent receptor n=1 Tax=Spirosoma profusum TaxID=2771354 RepID=A0A927AW97_9BACT|nr:TonB-dependent receptor [Spirosoma profusum]MBD2705633.1 TonB-dependent receptor [Spirosoma profusum]